MSRCVPNITFGSQSLCPAMTAVFWHYYNLVQDTSLRISLLLPDKSLQNFNNYIHRVIIARGDQPKARCCDSSGLSTTDWLVSPLLCPRRHGYAVHVYTTLHYSTAVYGVYRALPYTGRCYRWPATAMDQSKVQSTRQPQVPPARCANCRFAIQPFIFTRSAAHGRLVNSIAGSVTRPVGTVSRF